MEERETRSEAMASEVSYQQDTGTAVKALRFTIFGRESVYWLVRIPLALALIAILFWTFLPVLWTVTTSLKSLQEYYRGSSISLIPRDPTTHNYLFMFKWMPDFPTYFKNSIVVCLAAVVLNVMCATLMGYAFARMTFRGRDLLFYSLVLSMFIPRAGHLMAAYELMDFLHLRDNLLGLILFFASGLSMPLFIMRQTFLTLPRELEEAAFIDGASRFRVFRSIAIPFGASGMLLIAILTFVRTWGDYLFTITMVDTASKYTVGVGVAMAMGVGAMAQEDPEITQAGIQSAAYLLTALPAIALYLSMQRYFVRGLMEGALKF